MRKIRLRNIFSARKSPSPTFIFAHYVLSNDLLTYKRVQVCWLFEQEVSILNISLQTTFVRFSSFKPSTDADLKSFICNTEIVGALISSIPTATWLLTVCTLNTGKTYPKILTSQTAMQCSGFGVRPRLCICNKKYKMMNQI